MNTTRLYLSSLISRTSLQLKDKELLYSLTMFAIDTIGNDEEGLAEFLFAEHYPNASKHIAQIETDPPSKENI